MTEREKLIGIIQNSVDGCAEYWAGLIADGLLENGVKIPVEEQECVSVKMTNYERIKNMSIDEMAKKISNKVDCELCPACKACEMTTVPCITLLKEWLENDWSEEE